MTKTERINLADKLISPLAHMHVARGSIFLNSHNDELLAGLSHANMAIEELTVVLRELAGLKPEE